MKKEGGREGGREGERRTSATLMNQSVRREGESGLD